MQRCKRGCNHGSNHRNSLRIQKNSLGLFERNCLGDRTSGSRNPLVKYKTPNKGIPLVFLKEFPWRSKGLFASPCQFKRCSLAGTRTRVSWVRATYPNQLDYEGDTDSVLYFLVHLQRNRIPQSSTLGSEIIYARGAATPNVVAHVPLRDRCSSCCTDVHETKKP